MADPVSWLMIEPGWRVEASDGTEVGRIEEVTGDSNVDIFDGLAIAFSALGKPRYVPAEQVDSIVEGTVRLKLDPAAIEQLTKFDEPAEQEEIEPEKAPLATRLEQREARIEPQAGDDPSVAPSPRVVRPSGSALDLAARIRAGELSAAESVEAAIARAEAENPHLNFLVTDCYLQAVERAKGPLSGPFAGVPMLVKDLTETAGVRTTFSSRAFADYVPAQSAAVVRRMEDAGFVVIGKSNTPEFGITAVTESDLNGACRNPYDTDRTPGGSSGGAAAAVAAGVLPLAHGSDGGGSIRIPASCCGLFGIKPSRGRVSSAPYGSGSLELSQSGPLATNVRDAAAFLDAVAGYEPGDAHWPPPPERPFLEECDRDPGRLRIALTVDPPLPHPVDPNVAQVARDAAEALAALGHDIVEATPPWHGEDTLHLFSYLWRLTPALYPVGDPSLLMPINRQFAEWALEATSVDFARAVAALQAMARRVVRFWDGVDVVLTPGLAMLPVPIGWVFEPDDVMEQYRRGGEFTPFTPLVNVTGQPAAMFPFGTVDGLPVGVQLIGPPAGEALLFRLCAQLEAAAS